MANARSLRDRIFATVLAAGAGACGKTDSSGVSAAAQPQAVPTPATAESSRVSGPLRRPRRSPYACVTRDAALRLRRDDDLAPAGECPYQLDGAKHTSDEWPTDLQPGGPDNASADAYLERYGRRLPVGTPEPRDEAHCCYGPKPPPVVRGRALVTACGRAARVDVVRGATRARAKRWATEIGAAWQRDAVLEHASVASFARATLELMAHAAPAALIEATQRASLDEIRHARLCFALASRYLGRDVAAGAVEACAPRGGSLADLAVRVFVEGCVGETVAALVANRSIGHSTDLGARAALEVIAADEARHAELAWSTLAWTVTTGGDDVRAALAGVVARMDPFAVADDVGTGRARNAKDEVLASHGRLTPRDEAVATRDAWRDVIRPSIELLLAARGTLI